MLAMFANGEQDQFQQELKDRAEQNRLLRAEAQALGQRKLKARAQESIEQSGEGYEKLNGNPEPGPKGVTVTTARGTEISGYPAIRPDDPRWNKPASGDRAKWFALRHRRIQTVPKKMGEVPLLPTEPGRQTAVAPIE